MRLLPAVVLLVTLLAGCSSPPDGDNETTPGDDDDPDPTSPPDQVPYVAPNFTVDYVAASNETPGDVRFTMQPANVLDLRGNTVDGALASWGFSEAVELENADFVYGMGTDYGVGPCGEPLWQEEYVVDDIQEREYWRYRFGELAYTVPPLHLVGGTELGGSDPVTLLEPGSRAGVTWKSVSASTVRFEFGFADAGEISPQTTWSLTYDGQSLFPATIRLESFTVDFTWQLGSEDATEASTCDFEPSSQFPMVVMDRLAQEDDDPPTRISLQDSVRAAVEDPTLVEFQQFQTAHPDFFLGIWQYKSPPDVPAEEEGWRLFFEYPGSAQRFIVECGEVVDGPLGSPGTCEVGDGYSDMEYPSPRPDWGDWERVSNAALEERLATYFDAPIDVFHTYIDGNGNMSVDIGWSDAEADPEGGYYSYRAIEVDARDGLITGARGLRLHG